VHFAKNDLTSVLIHAYNIEITKLWAIPEFNYQDCSITTRAYVSVA
jgi:hypothetical protein